MPTHIEKVPSEISIDRLVSELERPRRVTGYRRVGLGRSSRSLQSWPLVIGEWSPGCTALSDPVEAYILFSELADFSKAADWEAIKRQSQIRDQEYRNETRKTILSAAAIDSNTAVQFVAAVVFFICALSIPVWVAFGILVINPLLSVVGLVCAFTFWGMGWIAKRQIKQKSIVANE